MMPSGLQPGPTLIGGWAHGASVLAEVLRGAAGALAVFVLIFGAFDVAVLNCPGFSNGPGTVVSRVPGLIGAKTLAVLG
jgi:hypothetical protein